MSTLDDLILDPKNHGIVRFLTALDSLAGDVEGKVSGPKPLLGNPRWGLSELSWGSLGVVYPYYTSFSAYGVIVESLGAGEGPLINIMSGPGNPSSDPLNPYTANGGLVFSMWVIVPEHYTGFSASALRLRNKVSNFYPELYAVDPSCTISLTVWDDTGTLIQGVSRTVANIDSNYRWLELPGSPLSASVVAGQSLEIQVRVDWAEMDDIIADLGKLHLMWY